MKGVCITADGIAFHRTIISGQGQYVMPQAIDLKVYETTIQILYQQICQLICGRWLTVSP